MVKTSLKEIKDALNKLPDDKLSGFFITHKMWFEDPEGEFGVCFCCDDDETEEHEALFEKKEMQVIIGFAKEIEADVKKVVAVELDEDLDQQYGEDAPL